MKNNNDKASSEKENKKVVTDKQFKDNEVREGKPDNSINDEANDKSAYPYKSDEDNQYKTQPEFIDRDSDSKDKS
ncbi:MAG: hypothetical protein ABJA35_08725 [Parafilimonas sp.]